MSLPSLSDIAAGSDRLSSTHLQGPAENDQAAFMAQLVPEQSSLARMNGISEHTLVQSDAYGQPQVVNTELKRTGADALKVNRAISTLSNQTFEGPVTLGAGQLTPRAAAMHLPRLPEPTYANYLQRAGGDGSALSREDWEQATEQLGNGYEPGEVAHALGVDQGHVDLVRGQLAEGGLEPLPRPASPAESSSGTSEDASPDPDRPPTPQIITALQDKFGPDLGGGTAKAKYERAYRHDLEQQLRLANGNRFPSASLRRAIPIDPSDASRVRKAVNAPVDAPPSPRTQEINKALQDKFGPDLGGGTANEKYERAYRHDLEQQPTLANGDRYSSGSLQRAIPIDHGNASRVRKAVNTPADEN